MSLRTTQTLSNQSFSADRYRLELSVRAKNGLNFIIGAAIVWSLIAVIWSLPYPVRQRALFTFFAPMPLLPLAFLFSKILKTEWIIADNPLAPLGLWLNFAQLFYFPFLIFAYMKHPEDFVMAYAIITGAHFFPYGWFYATKSYAVMAGIISVGATIIGLKAAPDQLFLIPAFVSAMLVVLAVWLFLDYRTNKARFEAVQFRTTV